MLYSWLLLPGTFSHFTFESSNFYYSYIRVIKDFWCTDSDSDDYIYPQKALQFTQSTRGTTQARKQRNKQQKECARHRRSAHGQGIHTDQVQFSVLLIEQMHDRYTIHNTR